MRDLALFVTVGNATQPFDRLIDALGGICDRGIVREDDVFVQLGSAKRRSDRRWGQTRILSERDFHQLLASARGVLCHCGAGTLLQALAAGKTPIAVPRQRRFGEHVDDHQLELGEALAREGRVVLVRDLSELGSVVDAVMKEPSLRPAMAGGKRMRDLVTAAMNRITLAEGR